MTSPFISSSRARIGVIPIPPAMSTTFSLRRTDAKDDEQRERRDVERRPVVRRDAVEHELVPGRDLMEPGERDRRIRGEVNGVPPLVAKAAAHDDDRRDD